MLCERELRNVLARHAALQAGVTANLDEVVRIAQRIVRAEAAQPRAVPDLPPSPPDWECAYWGRRAGTP